MEILKRSITLIMNILREIFRGTNGDLSSKRIIGTILTLSGIVIGYIAALSLDPVGVIDESILIFMGTLITSGLGLLGVSVKEKKIDNYGRKEYEEDNN